MRHRKHKYRLASDSSHRKALMRNLACSLIEHERIVTTVHKAKALRGYVEKLITAAKRGGTDDLASIRKVASVLNNKKAVKKIFAELAGRFDGRPGGYTKVLRLGHRKGDAAEMAMIQFVDYLDLHKEDLKAKKAETKKAAKKEEIAQTPSVTQAETAEVEEKTNQEISAITEVVDIQPVAAEADEAEEMTPEAEEVEERKPAVAVETEEKKEDKDQNENSPKGESSQKD